MGSDADTSSSRARLAASLIDDAVKKFNDGLLTEALSDFNLAVKAVPHEPQTLLLRALCRQRQGLNDLAKTDISAALRLAPASPLVLREAARLYFKLEEPMLASTCVEKALEIEPQSGEALILRADLAWFFGPVENAGALTSAAVESQPDSLKKRLWAARHFLKSGSLLDARTHLERALEFDPGFPESHQLSFELHCRSGFYRRAMESLNAVIQCAPALVSLRLLIAKMHIRQNDFESALKELEKVSLQGFATAEVHCLRGVVLAKQGLRRQSAEAVQAMLKLEPRRIDTRLRAAEVLASIGEFKAAELNLNQAISLEPRCARAYAKLAQLALWNGSIKKASSLAAKALSLDPGSSEALLMAAGVRALQADYDGALLLLDKALKINPRQAETRVWRGEVLRRQGRASESLRDLSFVLDQVNDDWVSARANRALALLDLNADSPLWKEDFNELLEKSPALLSGFSQDPQTCRSALEEALTRLGGNRSALATLSPRRGAQAGLKILPIAAGARKQARILQRRILYRDPEAVFADFERLLAQFPDHPLVHTHRGELHLWLGQYDKARESFSTAVRLQPQTRWAYIGLCAVDMLQNNLPEALEWCAEGLRINPIAGRTMYVYRGEALRKMGRLDEASADLSKAIELDSRRIGAWINMALLHEAAGNALQARGIFERIKNDAAALLADARIELEQPAKPPPNQSELIADILRKCLEMMRGNRSSSIHTYFNRAGDMKSFQPSPDAWEEAGISLI